MDPLLKDKQLQVNEDKRPGCKKISTFLAVILLLVAIAAVVISAVGVGVSVSEEFRPTNGLTVVILRRGEIRGEYRNGSLGGIHFHSGVNSSFVDLSVTTTSGDAVVDILHPVNLSMTMVGVDNNSFLVMENQHGREKYVDYVIPKNVTNLMKSIMTGQGVMTDEILKQLDNETVNETRQSSLEKLAMRKEALLIIEAAEVLGSRGVHGTEYPAAMSFYQLAMRLLMARSRRDEETGNPSVGGEANYSSGQPPSHNVTCSRGGGYCRPSECPTGNTCDGLCGYNCWCWRWLCGDCCVHNYCLTHDQCCTDRGFFSWACLSVAWRVWWAQCSDTYNC